MQAGFQLTAGHGTRSTVTGQITDTIRAPEGPRELTSQLRNNKLGDAGGPGKLPPHTLSHWRQQLWPAPG